MNYKDLLVSAVDELVRAADEMAKPTRPSVPMPRPRIFVLGGDGNPVYEWPWVNRDGDVYWRFYACRGKDYYGSYSLGLGLVEKLLEASKYQPRPILRTLRRIQTATAWCLARAEGRRRMAQEILRQQAKAVEALEAEMALYSLK